MSDLPAGALVVSVIALIILVYTNTELRYRWFWKRKVYSLQWNDLQEGHLHDWDRGEADLKHSNNKRPCWLYTLCAYLNASWLEDPKSHRKVGLPRLLLDEYTYIQTDSKVLLSYLLGTGGNPSWLQCHRSDQEVVYHLHSGAFLDARRRQYNFTKGEAECLIEGYPIWYRQTFQTKYGHDLHSPLWPISQIGRHEIRNGLRRPGWILALGFQADKPGASFYIPPRISPDNMTADDYINPLRPAMVRMRDSLEKHRSKFPHHDAPQQAYEAIREILRTGTNSGVGLEVKDINMMRWHQAREFGGAGKLSKEETEWCIRRFGGESRIALGDSDPLDELTREECRRAGPLIDAVSIAAYFGVVHVMDYVKNGLGSESRAAAELRNMNGNIWLRDCH